MGSDIRRAVEVHVDVERSYIVDDTNTRVKENPRIYRGSEFIFRAHLMRGTDAFIPEPGAEWYFAIDNVFGAGHPSLVVSDNSTFNKTTDWDSLNVAAGLICWRVNTSSEELKIALGTTASATMYAELWYTTLGGTASMLIQFPITVGNIVSDISTEFNIQTYSSGILKYDGDDIILVFADSTVAHRWVKP